MSFAPSQFLDLARAPGPAAFDEDVPVWEALKTIGALLEALDWPSLRAAPSTAQVSPGAFIGENVRLGEGTVVEPGANIKGPAWIGDHCEIRSGAYLRENVIAGNGAVLGNSCEFKNCILFDEVESPHFNYVGDSILGYKAHLGAGVILSNVRLDREQIAVRDPLQGGKAIQTGLRKFGAIIGERTEIGCNSVLSPGSIIGRDCVLYPGTHWMGVLPSDHLVKLRQEQVLQEISPRNQLDSPPEAL